MRLPNSSCLLCRHLIFFRPLQLRRVPVIASQPASSLSAIHHGLRQSQKSRPQGFNQSSSNTLRPDRSLQNSDRRRGSDRPPPPPFKIRKGKKDITYRGPEPQSRRSRFNDPTKSFGKRSLVYQMRHGHLKHKVAELEGRASGNERSSSSFKSSRAPSDRMTSEDFMEHFVSSTGRQPDLAKHGRGGRAPPARAPQPIERPAYTKITRDTRDIDRERLKRTNTAASSTQRGRFTGATSFGDRPEPFSNRTERPNAIRNEDDRDAQGEQHVSRKTDDGPIRIHHTTAASQFLYGRSVVEAALKDSRRQLYRLYIYNGDDRQNTSQDDVLAKLARQKGIDVTKVPNSGLRMMDKMSAGRPHNGCILEASPLPQLPLKALGPLSEDPQKPGFYVTVAHQLSEDAKINGTSDFVTYHLPKERKPFVLLLDGILDPANLGAIIRTAAFLGVNGIAITKGSSATLTAVAVKASAGASETMTLFSISSTMDFLTRSKENGWLVYAAVPAMKRSRRNTHLTVDRVETYDPLSTQPTVLVIGSEGEGLKRQVRREADHEVSIPSALGGVSAVVDSLNVSVATGILCSAFLKKQSSGMIEIEDPSESSVENNLELW
ncbi:hypothetical protein F5B22DRAFT_641251 [Xylaria bambusicola]|uniref:uncharacterized protein n=1 Tax=Xylaria bambusicola TaxID=326684 RepID=UPI002007628C|nr:uncharacterized protein F5B22DRAFT_641251 [Xylaria bambusicola]KAI0528279.1 hypothetical protein F5B22DRAFT_641251 [Xylaria bambusicola]